MTPPDDTTATSQMVAFALALALHLAGAAVLQWGPLVLPQRDASPSQEMARETWPMIEMIELASPPPPEPIVEATVSEQVENLANADASAGESEIPDTAPKRASEPELKTPPPSRRPARKTQPAALAVAKPSPTKRDDSPAEPELQNAATPASARPEQLALATPNADLGQGPTVTPDNSGVQHERASGHGHATSNERAGGLAGPGPRDSVASKKLGPPRLAHPAYKRNPPTSYPLLARRRHQEGTVLLRVQVSAHGKPLSVKLKQSSGFEALDQAALAAVATWQFEPAKRNNEAIASTIEVPVRFSLQP